MSAGMPTPGVGKSLSWPNLYQEAMILEISDQKDVREFWEANHLVAISSSLDKGTEPLAIAVVRFAPHN